MKRVEYDISKSEYCYKINRYSFYFSSKFNMDRFVNSFIDYVAEETAKFKAKYKIPVVLTDYLLVALYIKIEKRGFKVLYSLPNDDIIELSRDYVFKIRL